MTWPMWAAVATVWAGCVTLIACLFNVGRQADEAQQRAWGDHLDAELRDLLDQEAGQ